MRSWPMETTLLALCMLCTGFATLTCEFILAAMLSMTLGNSFEQWAVTICIMLFFMGVAGLLQRRMKDDHLLEKFILLESVLAFVCAYAPVTIYATSVNVQHHFQIIFYSIVALMGFLMGLEIPIIMNINKQFSRSLWTNISETFACDLLGSALAAPCWVYIFLGNMAFTMMSYYVAGVNLAVAVFTYAYFTYKQKVSWKLIPAMGLSASALIFGFVHNTDWEIQLHQKLFKDPIVYNRVSKYQDITFTLWKGPNGLEDLRLHLNGHVQFGSLDQHIYHELLVHPAMNLATSHRNVLILGGGDGLALSEVLKYKDVESVTLVDLDPAMIKVASEFPPLVKLNKNAFADARAYTKVSPGVIQTSLKRKVGKLGPYKNGYQDFSEVYVFNIDAYLFLSQVDGRQWDVVIVDMPDPRSPELVKLYSEEFYLKVNRLLADDGVMVVQSTSPYHARSSFMCIRRTIEASGFTVFPMHINVPSSFGDWGFNLAFKEHHPKQDIERRIAGLTSWGVPVREVDVEVFRQSLHFMKSLRDDEDAEINTLTFPVLLDLYTEEAWII